MTVVDWILIVAAGAVALPGAILLGECLASLLPVADRGRAAAEAGPPPGGGPGPRPQRAGGAWPAPSPACCPARDRRSPDRHRRQLHRRHRRRRPRRRGGGDRAHGPGPAGQGLRHPFGLEHLDADPPEVVVLVDADCRVSARRASRPSPRGPRQPGGRCRPSTCWARPSGPTPKGVISALAVLVRNRVRPRGLRRLGLPCHLTGSGMAFPWRVLRDAPETGSNLVEDLVMGIEMALRGHPPLLCPAGQRRERAARRRRRGDEAAPPLGARPAADAGELRTAPAAGGPARARPRSGGAGPGPGRAAAGPAGHVADGARSLALAVAAALGWASWLPALVAGAGLTAVGVAVLLGWAKFAAPHAAVPLPAARAVLRAVEDPAVSVAAGRAKAEDLGAHRPKAGLEDGKTGRRQDWKTPGLEDGKTRSGPEHRRGLDRGDPEAFR